MSGIQELFDLISKATATERSKYHLTLGGLVEAIEPVFDGAEVKFDFGGAPCSPHSYRGYYSDLSFASCDKTTVGELLDISKRSIGNTFEGYKGGQYTMDEETPLWAALEGCCGLAIVGLTQDDEGSIILITKDVS